MAANTTTQRKDPPLLIPLNPNDVAPPCNRRHPFSSKELRDIRSLIGVARASNGRGAAAGKRSGSVAANDATAQPYPLSGRRVMVPMTSMAFFEGILQPPSTILDWSELSKVVNPANATSEHILVNDRGKLVEMTRSKASDYFEKQQHGLTTLKKSANGVTGSLPKKSSIKSSATPSTKNNTATDTPLDRTVPLMEIRETCDIDGNVINSEVVNVSNAMKRLGDGLKSVSNSLAGAEEDGKQLGELLAQTLKAGEGDIKLSTCDLMNEEKEVEGASSSETKKLKEPISDTAYEAICSRLGELERLEEEAAKSKKENTRSSKKLQSSGWSKGFLNNTKKKNVSRGTEKKVEKLNDTNMEQRAKGSHNVATPLSMLSSSSPSHDSSKKILSSKATTTPKFDQADPLEEKSRVSFSSDNEVKEIPRIGHSKVPPRPTSSQRPISFTPSNDLQTRDNKDLFSPVDTIPFDENVFKGVVKERNTMVEAASVRERRGGIGVKESRHQGDNGSMVGNKKLSRFAQRRLQREQK